MKLIDRNKIGSFYSYDLPNARGVLQFGFYKSGQGFVAINGQVADPREIAMEHGMSEANARRLPVRDLVKWFIYKYCQ